MKTIGEIIQLSGQYLAGQKRGKRIAEEIIAHVLGIKKLDLYLQYDKPLVEAELGRIREMLKRVVKNEPLEYVLGEVEFFGCRIRVDKRVLIPRPETEILVEKIANEAKSGILWDICCGSGCIGIALKKANPELQVFLSDISQDALNVAAENAKLNRVEVTLLQGDLLEPFKGEKADWIICNPPYVSEEEYGELDPSVKDFEPKLALVGGPRGTEFYERLAANLPKEARVFFEIGSSQAKPLQELFPSAKLEYDWAGHPRYLRI